MARIAFERMTRDEIGEIAPDGIAVLPTAAIEQHGPHCPVGLDTINCVAVANGAAEAVRDDLNVVVCPCQHFGSSDHHWPWPGVLTLRSTTYLTVVLELLDSLRRMGFRQVLVLNGHGGNELLIQQAARDFVLDNQDMHVVAGSYWDIARAALEAVPTDGAFLIPGHAGDFETSVMLYLHEELVRLDRRPDPGAAVVRGARIANVANWSAQQIYGPPNSGVSDDASRASAQLGRRYFEVAVSEVARLITGMCEAP